MCIFLFGDLNGTEFENRMQYFSMTHYTYHQLKVRSKSDHKILNVSDQNKHFPFHAS